MQEVKGELFGFDKICNSVLLKQQGSRPDLSNLRLLKASFIKASDTSEAPSSKVVPAPCSTPGLMPDLCKQTITAATPPKQPVENRLPYIDAQRCNDRLERAVQVCAAASHTCAWKRNGISLSCQKAYPCSWPPLSCRRLQQQRLQKLAWV